MVTNSDIQDLQRLIQSQTNSENVQAFQSILTVPISNADDEPITTL